MMTGNWFWAILLAGIVAALWESVGVIEVGIVLADILAAIFYGSLPVVVYPTLFLLNIIVFGKSLFFKPLAPSLQQ